MVIFYLNRVKVKVEVGKRELKILISPKIGNLR